MYSNCVSISSSLKTDRQWNIDDVTQIVWIFLKDFFLNVL